MVQRLKYAEIGKIQTMAPGVASSMRVDPVARSRQHYKQV